MHAAVQQPPGMALFVILFIVGAAPVAVPPRDRPAAESDRKAAEATTEDLKPQGPLPPRGFLPHCLELINKKRYAEARMRLAPVVADHPGWARAHLYLGLTYNKENRFAEAKPYFERALALDPQQDATRVYHGWCLYYLGEIEASRKMFESYPQHKAGFAEASFALGLIDFDDDQLDSAKARFGKAIELAQARQDKGMEAKSRARLADVLVRTGDLEEARQQIERSLELNPDNYEVWFKLSRVLQRLGDSQGARRARQKHAEVRERIRPTEPRSSRRPGE